MRQLFAILFFIIPSLAFSQLGGSSIYEFVNNPVSARENALGGRVISLHDSDVSFGWNNTSLLDSSYSGQFSSTWGSLHVTQTNIGLGSFAYAHSYKNIHFITGVNFVNYGRFAAYNELGEFEGTFFASDYEILFGGAYKIKPKISVGFSIKPILSYLENYSSYGLLSDISSSYIDTASNFTASAVISNIGWQLTTYTENNKEVIPYSIDIGVTKKLKYAPFRFSLTYEGLQKFDLSYNRIFEEENTLINQEDQSPDKFRTFSNNLLNHFHLGAELLLFKSLNFDFGYNFRKAYELSYGPSNRGVGFSFGFNLNISKFNLSYGWAKQHVAGGTNYFTFATNVDDLYKRFTK